MGNELSQRSDADRVGATVESDRDDRTGKQTRISADGNVGQIRARILALRAQSQAASSEGIAFVTRLLPRPDQVFAVEGFLITGTIIRDRATALGYLPQVEALAADARTAYDAAIKTRGGTTLDDVLAAARQATAATTGDGEISDDNAIRNRQLIAQRKAERDARVTTRQNKSSADKAARRTYAFEAWIQEHCQNYYSLPPDEQARIHAEWDRTEGTQFDQREQQIDDASRLAQLRKKLLRPPIQNVTLTPANQVNAPVARGKKHAVISRGTYNLPVADDSVAREFFALQQKLPASDPKVAVLVSRYVADVHKSWAEIVGKTVDQRYDQAADAAADSITPEILIQYGRPADIADAKRELNPFLDDGVTVDLDSNAWAYEVCQQRPPDGKRRPGLVTAGLKASRALRARFAGYLADRAWAAKTGQTIADSVYSGDVAANVRGISEDDIYKLLGKVLTVEALLTTVSTVQQTQLLVAIEDSKLAGPVRPDLTEAQQLDFERKAVKNQPLVTADGTPIPVGSANLTEQRVMTARVEAKRLEGTETSLRTTVATDTQSVADVQEQLDDVTDQIIAVADKKVGQGGDTFKALHAQQEALMQRKAELEGQFKLAQQKLGEDQGQLDFTSKYRNELATATKESVGTLDHRLTDEIGRIEQRHADTQAKLDALRKKGWIELPIDTRAGGDGETGARGGTVIANAIAKKNYETEEQAYVKDLEELDRWRKKLTGYQRDNQLGRVTTGAQLDQGTQSGTNQDRWLTVEGRIGYAALAGGEEAVAFVIKVLAGIVDYSIPGLVEKGGTAVATALGADPKNLPGGVTWAAAEMRKGAADLERRAAENTAVTGGGWDVGIIKGVVGFLVLYLPTMGFGGAGAAIGRAVSAARYAELLGTSVGLATMGALATVGESWETKLKTIVPLALMPAIGAKLGGINKVPVRLASTFMANAATDVLAQADLVAAGRIYAETGDLQKAIAVAGAKVNFSKALTNGLLGVAMEAHSISKAGKASRLIENEMPVLEYAPQGDAGPKTYLRLSIQGERRVWNELSSKPTGQRVLKIEAHEYSTVKNPSSEPGAVLDVLDQAATRADVTKVLDDATAVGNAKLARTKNPTERAELTSAIARVGELKGLVGKTGKRENLTLEELETARAMLGDGAMGYAEINGEVSFRQEVYDFQNQLAIKAGGAVEGSRRAFESKQVEYDKACKDYEKLDKQTGPEAEAQRNAIKQRRDALGEEVVKLQDAAIAKTREIEAEVQTSTAAFERKLGGKIQFGDEPRTLADTRLEADRLARSGPGQTQAQAQAELARYNARQDQIADAYQQVQAGTLEHPNTTAERLKLAVEGDATGERIPLNFKDADQFHELQRELAAVFAKYGITDVVVQQLGSGTTGWRGNPNKDFAPWKSKSDVDFAIFSDQLLQKTLGIDAEVNDKITQGGRYTVMRNQSKVGGKGFYDTPVGAELKALARRWNERVYGTADYDGFDFKLNLSDKPFGRAVNVVQNEPVRPLGGARVIDGAGTNQYFGVPVAEPKMGGRIAEAVVANRENHVTVIEPEELAGLSEAARAELRAGVELGGAPQGTGMIKRGEQGWYLMTVEWPEANVLRAKYGLPPKQFHVTIGKASGVVERKPQTEAPEVQADDGGGEPN